MVYQNRSKYYNIFSLLNLNLSGELNQGVVLNCLQQFLEQMLSFFRFMYSNFVLSD